MRVYADALPLAFDRADAPRRRQAVTRSVQDRSDVREFDKRERSRDPTSRHDKGVGINTVVVASAWLAFYAVAAFGADVPRLFPNGARLDVFQMHLNIGTLPVQRFHDRSVVFSADD